MKNKIALLVESDFFLSVCTVIPEVISFPQTVSRKHQLD